MTRPRPRPATEQLRALRRAKALLARIDRMPAPESARAIGTPEAQTALHLIAKAARNSR